MTPKLQALQQLWKHVRRNDLSTITRHLQGISQIQPKQVLLVRQIDSTTCKWHLISSISRTASTYITKKHIWIMLSNKSNGLHPISMYPDQNGWSETVCTTNFRSRVRSSCHHMYKWNMISIRFESSQPFYTYWRSRSKLAKRFQQKKHMNEMSLRSLWA